MTIGGLPTVYLWLSRSYQYGTRTVRKGDYRPKTYNTTIKCLTCNAAVINVCFTCPEIAEMMCTTLRRIFTHFFEDGSHSRTTVEWRQNINFNLALTVLAYRYWKQSITRDNKILLPPIKAREWAYSQILYIQMLTGNPMNSSVPLKAAFTTIRIWPINARNERKSELADQSCFLNPT